MVSEGVDRNHEWYATHPDETGKYSGQWIAILDERIVGSAPTLKELRQNPAVGRRPDVLVVQVPTLEDLLAVF